MYQFLLNMWLMNRIDSNFLQFQVDRGRISKLEMDMILATPQF